MDFKCQSPKTQFASWNCSFQKIPAYVWTRTLVQISLLLKAVGLGTKISIFISLYPVLLFGNIVAFIGHILTEYACLGTFENTVLKLSCSAVGCRYKPGIILKPLQALSVSENQKTLPAPSVAPTLTPALLFRVFLFLFPHYSHISTCGGQYKHSRQAIGFTCHIVLIHQEHGRKSLWPIWTQTSLFVPALFLPLSWPLLFPRLFSDRNLTICTGAHTKHITHTHTKQQYRCVQRW